MKLDKRHYMTHCMVCKMLVCAGCTGTNCRCDALVAKTPAGKPQLVVNSVGQEPTPEEDAYVDQVVELVKPKPIAKEELPLIAKHILDALPDDVADEEVKKKSLGTNTRLGQELIEGVKEVIEVEKQGKYESMAEKVKDKVKKRKPRKKK